MRHSILAKLRGALELIIFMPSGETVFRKTSWGTMLRSFLIPLIMLPYGMIGMSLAHNTELQTLSNLEGMNNFTTSMFIMVTMLKGIIVMAFMLGVIYAFAKFMNREQYFYDYIAASNWTILPKALFSVPLLIILLSGGSEWISVYAYASLLILYNVAVSAFITWRMLNIPWELGGALAIFGLLMGETANKIVALIGTNYFS